MRKEDKQAIILALALFERECMQHKKCKTCPLYEQEHECLLAVPPDHISSKRIITQLEYAHANGNE